MTVSDQIISVLNTLCEKFGLAIDWTAANVLPYATDLCGRVVTFSIAKSIASIVFFIIGTLITFFIFKFFLKKGIADDWCSEGWVISASLSGVVFGGWAIASLVCIPLDIMNIIQACTIPELTVIETIETLISQK